MRQDGHAFVSDFITVAIGTMVNARAVKLAKPRTVRSQIAQTRSEQQSSRLESLGFGFTASQDPKALRRDSLYSIYAGLDDQTAVARHFVAAPGEELVRTNSVVPQKAMHAVRIFITRAVVMKCQGSVKIASQEKRGRQACRPCADDDAVV